MIKVDEDDAFGEYNNDYDEDDDGDNDNYDDDNFQVKWDSPTQDSMAIDRSRYKLSS